jgi:hypothetical protein
LKNKNMTSEDLGALHAATNKLEFLTLSIAGVTGQLTTRERGTYNVAYVFLES